jgi:membrane-associated protein
LGVVIFITLGRTFSDRILALDSVLGDFTWAFVALLAAAALGWKIWTAMRNRRAR